MNTGPRFAATLVLIATLLSSCGDSELADGPVLYRRTWEKCILQPNSKVHFDKQEPRYYTEGISQDLTDRIDAIVRQELSRYLVLNDPDSDLDFYYKADPRGYIGKPSIVLGFCRRGQRRDKPTCTQTFAFRELTSNLSYLEFMHEALGAEITYLLRPDCAGAEVN
jgi:hypothetical protein